ncbi:DUF2802 domain-containing protein [Teredinibacter turnerae]|uniref:DUF2802 domain-containing protein n=1 Tax=Teredinibacter turnerae TaxID=2426 RepID=UPI00040B0159|nr:DUF2802 domain-containing protein [Teredinibacter turnerae]
MDLDLFIPVMAIALAVFACAISLVGARQARAEVLTLREQYLKLARQLQAMEKKTATMISGSLGMGQRIMALEKKLREVSDQQHHYNAAESDFSYSQAHTMIDQGVDASTVAANTGLTVSEIELMELLHKTSRPAVYE